MQDSANGPISTAFVQDKSSQKGAHFDEQNQASMQAVLQQQLRNFDTVTQALDENLILRETIRAQAGEIERLNAENNDLTQKLQTVIKERDEALFNR